jgi:Williams-Beuren syndrome DDT (WSD), D-TOX E motif
VIAQLVLTVRAQFGLQVDEFTAWLNPKGNRELALRNTLTKWWPHIVPGMRKRLSVRRFTFTYQGLN